MIKAKYIFTFLCKIHLWVSGEARF